MTVSAQRSYVEEDAAHRDTVVSGVARSVQAPRPTAHLQVLSHSRERTVTWPPTSTRGPRLVCSTNCPTGVAWLRLNRPERRNAMDHYPGGHGPNGMGLRDALLEAIRNASEDKAVKVAVITGNGSVFSAGADLKAEPIEIEPARRRAPTVARDDGLLYGWYRLLESIWRSETPFIAAVNGPAIGGGCQLALACDLIYASETATFWEIFARLGLPLEGGAAWLLTRSLSLPLAKEMALLSEPLSATRAARVAADQRVRTGRGARIGGRRRGPKTRDAGRPLEGSCCDRGDA